MQTSKQFIIILFLVIVVAFTPCGGASGAEIIRVATNRYSVFAPYNTAQQINYNADNSSFTFTASALVIDTNGSPLPNTNVNFYIYNGSGGLKQNGTIATNNNGIAFFPYNTFRVFTSFTDTDYGLWTIRAKIADNPNINGTAYVNISIIGGADGTTITTLGGCNSATTQRPLCHHNPAQALTPNSPSSPRSPYSDNFSIPSLTSMAYKAHIRNGNNHFMNNSNSSNCHFCHVGLDREPLNPNVNATWGVHEDLQCIDCHPNPAIWPITIKSCYSDGCHPLFNNNLTNISTLATIEGIDNVSIYSTTDGSVVIPYSVHNGSQNSTTTGVPCWICHGPAHNITKPDPAPTNTNSITESSQCISCHGQKHAVGTSCTDCHTQDAHAIIKPDTINCIGCHNTGGMSTIDVDFTFINNSESVHRTLNFNDSNSITRNNSECWGCHGDGDASESAQPSSGHPSNFNTPKNCNNDDCHSLSQSQYNETMIYSHFQNANLNSNPNNITNYNITTTEQCQNCHINSIVTDDSNSNLSKVSHYASKKDLIDSFNCVYCHLNEDNSEDWGNATLINKDRVGTIEVNREDNNITLFQGQTVYLGEGYSLKLIEISALRGDAFIQILNKDVIVDQAMVGQDNPYTYEREVTIDNATFKTPAITVRINSVFTGVNESFIIFEAFRPRKIHTEKESKDSACFACHLYRYSNEKERYKVIDREAKDDGRDIIYYTGVLLDYKLENKSKIYFNDENYVFDQLGIMDKFISVPNYQKYLEDGQTWQFGDNYFLKFIASSTDRQAWLDFIIDNKTVEEDVVTAGSVFTYGPGVRYKGYTDTNMTIFTTNVSSVFLGQKNFIILNDSELLSIQVLNTTANTTQFGYNSSWLHPGDRLTLGKIPESLHTPNLFDDTRDWADCVRCHDSSKNLRISQVNAISSRLGKHSILNAAAPYNAYMSDSIDKACLACHTDGTEPNTHSPTYLTPRNCTSCHTYQDKPAYGAKNISDEPHGYFSACELCHMPSSHEIIRPQMLPSISEANLSQTVINSGESVKLIATAAGGIGMKIRSAEYFIDTTGNPGYGIRLKPVDGVFDSQIKQVVTEINSTNISIGTHIIYVHAMERDNRWGEFYPVNFTIVSGAQGAGQNKKNVAALDLGSIIISLMVVYLIISKRGQE